MEAPRERGPSTELRPRAEVAVVSAGAGEMGGMVIPGLAMASPEAARADARPPDAPVPLREDEGLELNVAERAGTGAEGLEPRRQGRRFLLAVLPTDRIETASELSGTCKVALNEGVVELGGSVREIEGISGETEPMYVGDSTRAGSSDCWAGGEGGCGAREDACEVWGESREGSMILSLLRRDLFDGA